MVKTREKIANNRLRSGRIHAVLVIVRGNDAKRKRRGGKEHTKFLERREPAVVGWLIRWIQAQGGQGVIEGTNG